MFLGTKDQEHNPPAKKIFLSFKEAALWSLIVSALFDKKIPLLIALILAVVILGYYLYLILTGQTYIQFIQSKRAENDSKIQQVLKDKSVKR